MAEQKRNEAETKHPFPGQGQEYIASQAKDQTQQDKPVIRNHQMGLDNSGKNKKRGKNGFNSQLDDEDFLFFTIKKPHQQTSIAYKDQNVHDIILKICPPQADLARCAGSKAKNDLNNKKIKLVSKF